MAKYRTPSCSPAMNAVAHALVKSAQKHLKLNTRANCVIADHAAHKAMTAKDEHGQRCVFPRRLMNHIENVSEAVSNKCGMNLDKPLAGSKRKRRRR